MGALKFQEGYCKLLKVVSNILYGTRETRKISINYLIDYVQIFILPLFIILENLYSWILFLRFKMAWRY